MKITSANPKPPLNINNITTSMALYWYIVLTLPVPITDEEKKIKLNFYFNTTFRNAQDGKG